MGVDYIYDFPTEVPVIPSSYTYSSLILSILVIAAYWRLFEKAGEPGWAAIVPFYSTYVIYKIVYGNGWKFLLLLIPLANIVFIIKLQFDFAKAFGKSGGFGCGLLFLSFVFYPILAFGDATYVGPIK